MTHPHQSAVEGAGRVEPRYRQNWRVVNPLTSAALQLATAIGLAAMEWDGGDVIEVAALSALKRHHESLGLLIKDMERPHG